MPESFLILFAAGIMLAAAASDPRQVTLNWLRLAGILALAMSGLGMFFFTRGGQPKTLFVPVAGMIAAILGQVAFVQLAARRTQRALAIVAAVLGVYAAHQLLRPSGSAGTYWPALLSAIGIAAACGLVLMEMLLGHAYLTASQMTMRPFAR